MRISRRRLLSGSAIIATGTRFAIILPVFGSRDATAISSNEAVDLLSWVEIKPDNSAVIRIPQTDIGQGINTTLAQIIAEEMDLDWARVSTKAYDPRVNAERQNPYIWTTTLGSSSAHYLYEPVRLAAATIKKKLISAAALQLKVAPEHLHADQGHVVHAKTGRRIPFSKVAASAAELQLSEQFPVEYKPVAQRRLIGSSVPALELKAMTAGEKRFGIDIDVPGMRFAAISQSPVYGAKLLKVEMEGIRKLSGNPSVVRVSGKTIGFNSPVPEGEDPDLWAAEVRCDDAIAVVADTWWQAKTVLEGLDITWSSSKHRALSSEKMFVEFAQRVNSVLPKSGGQGNFERAMSRADQKLSALYSYPYVEAAPLEPMNCTALVDDNGVQLWTNSQFPDDAWRIAFETAGVDPNDVTLHLMAAGGGFGRRLHNDIVYQAIQIACQHRGIPIKLLATREESMKHSYYSPLTVAKFDAAVGSDGTVDGWRCRVASSFAPDQSYGATRLPFVVPNTHFEYERHMSVPVPFGWVRGVGFAQHLWMNFSFLDEIRLAIGADAIGFFRAHLDPSRIPKDVDEYDLAVDRALRTRRVLDYCVEKGGWSNEKPPGVGRGICASDSDYYPGFGSSTKAAMVDIVLDKKGSLTVNRVFIAIDAGTVINPDIVKAQLEGGVAFALSTALYSEISVKNGSVEQSNFHDYPVLRMKKMPRVEVAMIPSDSTPLGVGEDAVPITIAALVNAIVDAGGPRIRRLPISREIRLEDS